MRNVLVLLLMLGLFTFNGTTAFADEIGETFAPKMKKVIYESTDVNMPDAAYSLLVANGAAFFAEGRSSQSLDSIATNVFDRDIEKNVLQYSSTIIKKDNAQVDDIQEVAMGSGGTLTVAIVHKGGNRDVASDRYIEPTYYQIFYIGATNIRKGAIVNINGVPVGQTKVQITDQLGRTHSQPMYIIVAGNLRNAVNDYFEQKKQARLNDPYREEVKLLMRADSRTEYQIGNAGKKTILVEKITFGRYTATPNFTILPEETMTINGATFGISDMDFLSTEMDRNSKFTITTNVGTFEGKKSGRLDVIDLNKPVSGRVSWTFEDGSTYEGYVINGKMDGDGIYTWANGQQYTGPWRDGQMHGVGQMRKSNGEIFLGFWDNGKLIRVYK